VIRPIAIGRRNWLFSGSENGAKLSAVMMTVVQTCRQLKINPHEYLADVLPKLASYETKSLKTLTPMEWKSSR
jgi:transposase